MTTACLLHLITLLYHHNLLLDDPPSFRDLLNKVASRAQDKWQLVGLQLNIRQDQLNAFQHQNPIICYSEVFDLWKSKGDPPFTWTTIIDALRTPSVHEDVLAKEIEEWRNRSSLTEITQNLYFM